MTLRTSLFNWGIYKSTLKRFRWGGFLYFVALFFCVPFILLVQNAEHLVVRYTNMRDITSVILLSNYRILPTLLTLLVPTVVAVLIFNNIHSAKQSVFVHGLPVTRKANYLSSLLAGFTLMALPVILNGLILLAMSFGSYDAVIASGDVFYWMAIQLCILFVMFSIASFTAFLTGNTAAHIGINILVHILPMLVALTIWLISDIFLYGFFQSGNFITDQILEYTPLVWFFNGGIGNLGESLNLFGWTVFWVYMVGALVVYWLGYLLYKNRKVEACGDVAAFRCFKPILKYVVTTAAAVAMFGILTGMNLSAVAVFTGTAVVTAIVYFACEMLMNKTFKVFGSYKGYCGFAVCVAAIIAFCAYTHMFGYETRIPETAEIESATVCTTWGYDMPLTEDQGAIETTRDIHQELIQDIPVVEEEKIGNHLLRVSYILKNGKEVHRRYRVSQEVLDYALGRMYAYTDYKMKVTGFDNLNIENARNMMIGVYMPSYSYNIAVNDEVAELLTAAKKDVEELSYRDLAVDSMMNIRINVHCTAEENQQIKLFRKMGEEEEVSPYVVRSFELDITPAFVNTYKFLREKGYYEEIISQASKGLWICKKPVTREQTEVEDGVPKGEAYSYKGQTGEFYEFRVSISDCVEIQETDARRLIEEEVRTAAYRDTPFGESYFIFNRSRDVGDVIAFGSKMISFTKEEMPDYLLKYLED